MATGFMRRHSILLFGALFAAGAAHAGEVALIGLIGNKAAVLSIDGGPPKTVKVGQKWNAVTVLGVENGRVTLELEGKRRVLGLGQHYRTATPSATEAGDAPGASPPPGKPDPVGYNVQTYKVAADVSGHFIANGAINGNAVRFLIDTGASVVALPASDALRLGLNYRASKPGRTQTANGVVDAYPVKLDRVKLGDIELHAVDAIVIEQGLPVALLGMSFLNRVEMRREGDTMTLLKRF